ncbi:hypothetical protein LZ32DRAFT_23027 [Colletotrichum eremochloae]|nr:hypothetical protein LZ32DRAFT_23027 [Colletotrichum eremochloae]
MRLSGPLDPFFSLTHTLFLSFALLRLDPAASPDTPPASRSEGSSGLSQGPRRRGGDGLRPGTEGRWLAAWTRTFPFVTLTKPARPAHRFEFLAMKPLGPSYKAHLMGSVWRSRCAHYDTTYGDSGHH